MNVVTYRYLQGLHHLQSCPRIKCHGSLSSLTCMVDDRLSLQLVGIGSRDLRRIVISALLSKHGKSHDHVAPQSVFDLWLAPELLLNPLAVSTESGDMFSLAIVIGEIWSNQYPLKVPLRKPLALQEALWNLIPTPGGSWPSRISVKRPEVPPQLHSALSACLNTDPNKRPTLKDFITLMMDRYPRENIMDNLFRRLESYATELEIRMQERTAELQEEKAKTDEILSLLMPSSVAKLLRNHQIVHPEMFESATVLFSKIPNFLIICSTWPGIHIIQILTTLYRILDDLIYAHEVYKVEAITDSYMVASGIPQRIGTRHALEASLLAISFLDGCNAELGSSAEIPQKLQLQIGIHSGPCAAGIIGHRLPRYCLFGDTVNTASRMQTYGEVNKIHIGQQTKDLLDDYPCSNFDIVERGILNIKGKGEVDTFWLIPTIKI
ncbi:receptor-type guanylate cyclase gcy-3-like [Paramacrobiotus metropolitanus]|uniref:receptor-type guanylate cyclase gcy-3-like n=1 Tax=Paramacrobiotus metropolitanus TaxID=2943436 RepID=UPI0024462CAB|nr:receptor-type guanylate cyclase gcy-3-like [Paramacrobiotus metropolitanus]